MAKIQRSDEINRIREGLMLDPSRENIPTSTTEKVQVVFDPQLRRVCDIVKSVTTAVTGNVTIFTTPSDKNFYLNSATLTRAKNGTLDDGTEVVAINVTVNGLSSSIIQLAGLGLTAANQNGSVSFPIPLLVDRNTAITISGSNFSDGAQMRAGTITGFTEEVH